MADEHPYSGYSRRLSKLFGEDIKPEDPRVQTLIDRVIAKGYTPMGWLDFAEGKTSVLKANSTDSSQYYSSGIRADRRAQRELTGNTIERSVQTPRGIEKLKYFPPTEDQVLGLDSGMATPGLAQRIVGEVGLAISDPARRRELERGVSDMATFGLAERLTGKASDDFTQEAAERDAKELGANTASGETSDHRLIGQLIGTFTPGGLANRATKTASSLVTRLAAKTRSPLYGAATGVLGGAASAPAVSGTIEGGRGAINAALGDGDFSDILPYALEAAKAAAQDPIGMGGGAVLGGLGGAASGIRNSDAQVGRDLQFVESRGGKPSVRYGAKGEPFEDPAIKGVRGTPENIGEVAGEGSLEIRGKMNRRLSEAGAEKARREAAAKSQLDARADVSQIEAEISELRRTPRTSKDTLAKLDQIEDKILRFGRHAVDEPTTMSVGELMGLKGLVGELANVQKTAGGVLSYKDVQVGRVYRSLGDVLSQFDAPDEINAPYANMSTLNTRSHQLLRLGSRKKTNINDDVAQNRLTELLSRRGTNTRYVGKENRNIEKFVDINKDVNPEFRQIVDRPALMGARERMRFKVPDGDLLRAAKGLFTSNVDPALATVVYPAGKAVAPLTGLAGPLAEKIRAAKSKDEELNRKRAERMRFIKNNGR